MDNNSIHFVTEDGENIDFTIIETVSAIYWLQTVRMMKVETAIS